MIRSNLRSRIPEIRAQLPEKLDATVRIAAEGIEAEAKSRAPVGTGALRDSIHTDKTSDAEYRVVAGDSDVFYGHIVEHGSVKQPAQPFLIPALEARRDDTLAAINRTLKGL